MNSTHGNLDRRAVLRTASLCLAGSMAAGTASGSADDGGPEPSVTFDDQESDGTAVTITRAATDADGFVAIEHEGEMIVHGPDNRLNLDAGETAEDVTLYLEEQLTEDAELVAVLIESNGGVLDRDTAFVSLDGEPPERIDGFGPTLVDADPDAGFEYPYLLYTPGMVADESRPVLVEPNNTGQTSDEFDLHLERAESAVNSGTGRQLSDRLNAPLVMPVFPRPREEPVDWTHYVHQLDAETMSIDGGPLERVDLQLLAMVRDARERLNDRGYPVEEGIMLNGFSASGNFVDRFVTLHPEEVVSVTAGGLNGMAILPIEEAKGHTLDFHVGIANLEALTGEPFDLDAFREVNQFLYIGDLDKNDTIAFGDAWTDEEFRDLALEVYGHHIQGERFPYCKAMYDEVGASSVFRMYDGEGHTPRPAFDDLVEFHERSLAGDDIEDIRADLGGNVPNLRANIEFAPREPSVGEQVAFDGTRSSVWEQDIVEFEWEFGDGTTATGELAHHTFEQSGGHNVQLRVTDDAGERYEDTVQVVVGDADDQPDTGDGESGAAEESDVGNDSGEENESGTDGESEDDEATGNPSEGATDSDGFGPGFGIGSTLAGLGGVSYLAGRRLRNRENTGQDE